MVNKGKSIFPPSSTISDFPCSKRQKHFRPHGIAETQHKVISRFVDANFLWNSTIGLECLFVAVKKLFELLDLAGISQCCEDSGTLGTPEYCIMTLSPQTCANPLTSALIWAQTWVNLKNLARKSETIYFTWTWRRSYERFSMKLIGRFVKFTNKWILKVRRRWDGKFRRAKGQMSAFPYGKLLISPSYRYIR